MQVELVFSKSSIREVEQANQKWPVAVYNFVHYFFPLMVIVSLPVAAIVNVMQQAIDPSPEWSSALGLLIASFVPAGVALWRFKDAQKKRNRKTTSGFPQTVILGDSGIETREQGGKIIFADWQHYSGFRQGKTTFFLKLARKSHYRALPFDQLSTEKQGEMRAMLLTHLPEVHS